MIPKVLDERLSALEESETRELISIQEPLKMDPARIDRYEGKFILPMPVEGQLPAEKILLPPSKICPNPDFPFAYCQCLNNRGDV